MKANQAFLIRSLFLALLFPCFLLLHGPVLAADDDVLQRLGLTPAAAKESLLGPLSGATPYHDAAYKAFKAMPAPVRAEVVHAGLSWIKAAVSAPGFLEAYRRLRESEKPAPPEPRLSADDEMTKMKTEVEKNIAEMRKNMAGMDAEMKKQMEAVIKEMRAQMERMEKDPQQKKMMRQGMEMSVEEDKKRHEKDLAEWQQRYPADPRELIKKRIREFLAVSASVDFSARLEPRGKSMIFSREDYEKEPPEWKLCFRAGKEATAAARAFAAAWLAELEKI